MTCCIFRAAEITTSYGENKCGFLIADQKYFDDTDVASSDELDIR